MTDEIKLGDKITIEGMNIAPDGKMYFNKTKKLRRKPMPVLTVVKVLSGEPELKGLFNEDL